MNKDYIIKYHRYVIALLAVLLLTGCATSTRNFGLSSNAASTGGDRAGTGILVNNFNVAYRSSIKCSNSGEMERLTKERLLSEMRLAGLNPIADGIAPFDLKGTLSITEEDSVNGWGAVAVGMAFLCPISFPIALALPDATIDDRATAEITLLHSQSNKTVLVKTLEKSDSFWLNAYMGGVTNSDSKLNTHLVGIVEKITEEIAKEVTGALKATNQTIDGD